MTIFDLPGQIVYCFVVEQVCTLTTRWMLRAESWRGNVITSEKHNAPKRSSNDALTDLCNSLPCLFLWFILFLIKEMSSEQSIVLYCQKVLVEDRS